MQKQLSMWSAGKRYLIDGYDRYEIVSVAFWSSAVLCVSILSVVGGISPGRVAAGVTVENSLSEHTPVTIALAALRTEREHSATQTSVAVSPPQMRPPKQFVGADARFPDRSSLLIQPQARLQLARPVRVTTQAQSGFRAFEGVGFPHIATGIDTAQHRYKPYTPLMLYPARKTASVHRLQPIPNVACPGGSAEKLATRAKRYDEMLLNLAIEHSISASLIKAVITVESCFNVLAKSPAGAGGLMQLMPATASHMGVEDVFDAEQNVRGGITYLKSLKKQFASIELALAAYNAGPGTVRRYQGVPPYPETQDYVARVMHNYRSFTATNRHRAATHYSVSN